MLHYIIISSYHWASCQFPIYGELRFGRESCDCGKLGASPCTFSSPNKYLLERDSNQSGNNAEYVVKLN